MQGERKRRSDRKHRQTIRMEGKLKEMVSQLAFNHNISENIVLCKAVEYALHKPDFLEKMKAIYPPRDDIVWLRGFSDDV